MKTNEKVALVLAFVVIFMVQILGIDHQRTLGRALNEAIEELEFNVSVEDGMVLEFEATAYAIGKPYSVVTRSGLPVVNRGFLKIGNMEIFTVAVDPRVIPLGSVVYIVGLGQGLVSDTGRDIIGMRIDICFTTMDDAMKFGRKKVKVIVLKRYGDDKE